MNSISLIDIYMVKSNALSDLYPPSTAIYYSQLLTNFTPFLGKLQPLTMKNY
jgi:hypothetical protein